MLAPASVLILSVSDHESVRISREQLLQSIGYSVVSMSSDCALKRDIPRDIAVAIIGHTVDDLSACRIVGKLRTTQPHLRILIMIERYSRPAFGLDGHCYVEDGPGIFLGCVAELIAMGKRTTGIHEENVECEMPALC